MRRKLIAIVIVTLLVLTTIAALLAYNTTNKGSEKLQVVTTFYPLYYFSSQIAGDRADVHMLIPDNSEPHSWQPRPSDMVRVDKSDVIIYNGAGFEPWIEDFLAQVSNPDLLIVDTSQGISMLLSDEVKEQFESAEEVVLNGPVVEVEASNSLEGTELVEAVTSHIVVNMSLLNGSVGMVRINISEPGDYRLFMLSDVDFERLTPEREQPEIELQVLGPSEFPEFVNTVFYGLEDGPTGEYVLELTSSDHNPVEFVILRWEEEGEGHDHHDHAALDPHFWLDPLTAKVQVARIAQAFCSADPVNATYYNNNADDLRSKLDQLNQDYILGLENRPKNDI
ncbi:MAG TPA: zinc ABC transporter substrate-binding protein, partial [Methanomassiliicoccales archaeon]|nr:zinc ABC transporter substrate-binding protein [Methanomassiliicoccales archaeon]